MLTRILLVLMVLWTLRHTDILIAFRRLNPKIPIPIEMCTSGQEHEADDTAGHLTLVWRALRTETGMRILAQGWRRIMSWLPG